MEMNERLRYPGLIVLDTEEEEAEERPPLNVFVGVPQLRHARAMAMPLRIIVVFTISRRFVCSRSTSK